MEKELNVIMNSHEIKDISSSQGQSENAADSKLSNASSFFSIFKSLVAICVLYMPFGFSLGGLIFSILALIFSAILNYMGYTRVVKASAILNSDFSGIALHTIGKWAKILIDILLIVSQIGILMYYIIYITHSFLELKEHFEIEISETIIFFFETLLLSAIFIPLTLKKSLSWLAPFHLVADLIIIIYVIVISLFSASIIVQNQRIGENITLINYKGMIVFFGMSILFFEGIGTIIPIYKSMQNPQKFQSILITTFIIILLLFNLMGIVGYLTFGSGIPDIQFNYVLLQYSDKHSIIYGITFFLTHVYMLNLIPSFALNANPAFRIIDKVITNIIQKPKSAKVLQNVITSLIIILVIIVGIICRNRGGKIIGLLGSLIGATLGLMFPGIFSLRLFSVTKFDKFKDIVLITIGTLVGLMGSINSILV